MSTDEMKKCPYCAETIRAEAVKCRYCGSMLTTSGGGSLGTPHGYWNRVSEGKKIAGVCTGIAQQLDSPVLIMPLRVFFVISTIFYFFGPIVYVLLWLLMPAPTDDRAAYAPGAASSPQPDSRHSPDIAPPVVNHYPGKVSAPPPPPAAERQDAGQEVVGDEVGSEANSADGTIGLDGESDGK
ncbi:MAG: PspC domain-containing protein [Candidatus Glassbacteria bacterium]|nr:PspC domain-containing protein [Candidatus Glassbacteria bacterium]